MFLLSTSRPNPQRPHGSIAMAGLLTYRLITNTFPDSIYPVVSVCVYNDDLQQLDCSGFSPDSLLIANANLIAGAKIVIKD